MTHPAGFIDPEDIMKTFNCKVNNTLPPLHTFILFCIIHIVVEYILYTFRNISYFNQLHTHYQQIFYEKKLGSDIQGRSRPSLGSELPLSGNCE